MSEPGGEPNDKWKNTSGALKDFRDSVNPEKKRSGFKITVDELKSPIEMVPAAEALKAAKETVIDVSKKAFESFNKLENKTDLVSGVMVGGASLMADLYIVALNTHPYLTSDTAARIVGTAMFVGVSLLTKTGATISIKEWISKNFPEDKK